MLGRDDLVLCSATLLRTPLREKIAAAAAAGFSALSLWVSDVVQARADELDDADLRTRLAAHGLEIAELDPLLHWLPARDAALPPAEVARRAGRATREVLARAREAT